jgi:hypothetical protein
MSADGTRVTGSEALERSYLRLLGCYPPSHREVHRDEMLGVLMAAARRGQRAPGMGETVNLVACGVAIRGRRFFSWLAGEPWQDAWAVVSLIAPVLMVVIATLNLGVSFRQAFAMQFGFPVLFWQPWLVPFLGGPAAVMAAWLAVVVLGLTGRRRAAAVIASFPLALTLLNLVTEVTQLSGAWSGGLPMFLYRSGFVAPVVMASLAACSLAFSAGPRRGLAIVGSWHAWSVIAGLSGAFGFSMIADLLNVSGRLDSSAFILLGVALIATAVFVTRLPSAAGWRVTVLIATGLLLNLAGTFPSFGLPPFAAMVVVLLVSLLFAVLPWPIAIASWRNRVIRESRISAG